jgi:hypothetical protein
VLHSLRKMSRVGPDLRMLHIFFEGDESSSSVPCGGRLSQAIQQV